jgi:hypothetical protein
VRAPLSELTAEERGELARLIAGVGPQDLDIDQAVSPFEDPRA